MATCTPSRVVASPHDRVTSRTRSMNDAPFLASRTAAVAWAKTSREQVTPSSFARARHAATALADRSIASSVSFPCPARPVARRVIALSLARARHGGLVGGSARAGVSPTSTTSIRTLALPMSMTASRRGVGAPLGLGAGFGAVVVVALGLGSGLVRGRGFERREAVGVRTFVATPVGMRWTWYVPEPGPTGLAGH